MSVFDNKYEYKNLIYHGHSHGERGEADSRPSGNDRKISTILNNNTPKGETWLFRSKFTPQWIKY